MFQNKNNMSALSHVGHNYCCQYKIIQYLNDLTDINDCRVLIDYFDCSDMLFEDWVNRHNALTISDLYMLSVTVIEIILKVTEGHIAYRYDNDFELLVRIYDLQKLLSMDTMICFVWEEDDYKDNVEIQKSYNKMLLLNKL